VDGGIFAVLRFSGVINAEVKQKRKDELLMYLKADGLHPVCEGGEPSFTVMQYNDPGVKPPFRRNEILIPVANFDVWEN
jgi:hypothetical protein